MPWKDYDHNLGYEATYWYIYVKISDDYWKKIGTGYDSEKEAEKEILGGKMRHIGKEFAIVKEYEKHTPTGKIFKRTKFSSVKETPVRVTQQLASPSQISGRMK